MKWFLLLTPMLLAQACAPVSLPALCTESVLPMSDHAAALLDADDDRAAITGDYLMRVIDAGCGR